MDWKKIVFYIGLIVVAIWIIRAILLGIGLYAESKLEL